MLFPSVHRPRPVHTTFVPAAPACSRDFLTRVLADLRVSYDAAQADVDRIPKKGPVVVVANHPFGGVEGMILADLLGRVRPDVKVMANYLLGRIPELRDLFFFVDPFGGAGAAASNVGALRQSIKHLEAGGLLVIFPAGEVSALSFKTREVTDKPWTPMLGRLIARTGATAVPVFFNGRNNALFQLAGLVHPRLRTALLPRQILNKQGRLIDVRVGSPISGRRLKEMDSDTAITAYLRHRTYMLRHRGAGEVGALAAASPTAPPARVMKPVVPIGDVSAMAAEVDALPDSARLVADNDYRVLLVRPDQAPLLMRELGRLREITFRAAGEGTGKSIDLDHFDSHYQHLIVWQQAKRELVGAYRLGQVDRIMAERGIAGLYTYELFDYRPELLARVGPALELGRSFVRPEYQRSFSPLLLLWKGIGKFLVDHPQYRYLIGPVSISAAYQSTSVQLMVQFLQLHHGDAAGSAMVSARTPFVAGRVRGWDDRKVSALARDADDLSDLVADLETDQKGVPVLIRQYIKLGAKFLSFNVDHAFNDCVDGLIVVDLARADRKVMERYLTKDGYAAFMKAHAVGV
ncbi:MAG TPA: lysophospholipid acyltransferase family protein [Tepidisphaeraceae bacterium]|nr:lysophospholipid acyltransferase family protein [Tepidisphaeraceae bacterium]